MSLKALKAKASKFWAKASKRAESEQQNAEWDDGRYSAQVIKANMNESKSSGRLQASITYKALDGEYKGQNIMSHDGLETEDSLMYFAKRLKACGTELPDDFDDIEDTLAELEKDKPRVQIRVKTKGEFTNVYVDKVISKDEEEDAEGSDETAEVELEKGMTVKAGKVEGVVVKIDEDENEAVIKDEDGKKHTVALDDCVVVQEEEEEDADEEDEDEEDSDDDDSDDSDSEDEEDEDEDDDSDDEDEEDDEEEEEKVVKKTSKLKKKK